MRKIAGLTLVELILSLSLSLLMLSGVYSVFIFSQKIFRTQMSLIHVQENRRALVGVLSHFILSDKDAYFTAATERHYQDGTLVHALYKREEHHAITELVEGVGEIKFSYDVLQEGALIEKKADEIVDWTKVKGVSISFLLCNQELKKRGYLYVAVSHKNPPAS